MICGLNRSDPVVRWDHSGESKQTTRGKLRLSGAAGAEMLLSDGTAAAVGMPVVAISGSRYGTYKAGDTGTKALASWCSRRVSNVPRER